jgi:hypothetical protein
MRFYKLTFLHGKLVIDVCSQRFYGWTDRLQTSPRNDPIAILQSLERWLYSQIQPCLKKLRCNLMRSGVYRKAGCGWCPNLVLVDRDIIGRRNIWTAAAYLRCRRFWLLPMKRQKGVATQRRHRSPNTRSPVMCLVHQTRTSTTGLCGLCEKRD